MIAKTKCALPRVSWVSSLALMAASALPIAVQAAAAEASAAAGGSVSLEEVVVTARQRAENIQSVPVAVSAVSGAFLAQRVATDTTALERYTPNVTLSANNFTSGGLTASIRGISFADLERSFEPAVGLAVDGVFLASNSGAIIDLFDVESVEVLRGPQGTLFGRNTTGGVISINHTRPTGRFGATADAIFGSYGRNDYKLMLNAPIVPDKLAAKVVLYDLNSDSFTRNIDTGKQDPGENRKAISASLLFTPSKAFSAWLTYEHIHDKSSSPKAVNLTTPDQAFCAAFGACITNGAYVNARYGYKVSLGSYPFNSPFDSDNFNLRLHYAADLFDLDSITGYLRAKDHLNEENTGAADFHLPGVPFGLPLLVANRTTNSHQFSQELRVTSHLHGPINFVAGLYYFDSYYHLDPQIVSVFLSPIQDFESSQNAKSYAGFAETYVNLPASTRLTLGGRYTHETKRFSTTSYNPGGPGVLFTCPDPTLVGPAFAACRDPRVSFDNFTPRVSLDHHFTDDLMIYATYARGFRSGGWNGRAQSPTSIGPYAPETVDNYEGGVRAQWLGRRLTTNLTAFDMKYANKQEEVLTPSPINPLASETTVQNAASASIKGVEFEGQAAPSQGLRLYSAVGYLDAKYDRFLVGGVDVKASRNFRFAPKWTVSFGADQTIPLDALHGRIVASANYKWTDTIATNLEKDTTGLNRDLIAPYSRFDLSLGFAQNGGPLGLGYRVSFFANDLTHNNGRIVQTLNAGAFWFGSVAPGRTLGVELNAGF